jgi:hypothetical protein
MDNDAEEYDYFYDEEYHYEEINVDEEYHCDDEEVYNCNDIQPPHFILEEDLPLVNSDDIDYEVLDFFWMMSDLKRVPNYNKVVSLETLSMIAIANQYFSPLLCNHINCVDIKKATNAVIVLQCFYRKYIHKRLLFKYEMIYKQFTYLYT